MQPSEFIKGSLMPWLAVFCSGVVALAGAANAKDSGSMAPNCALRLLDGGAGTTINQLRGKVLYVDFWASWCIPCKGSFPFMNSIDKDLKGKGLQVVAINLDEKLEDAKRFLAKHPVGFAVAVKANESCAKEFGVQGMPSSFIVDRKGVIRKVHPGFRPGDAGQLRALLGKLLGEAGPAGAGN